MSVYYASYAPVLLLCCADDRKYCIVYLSKHLRIYTFIHLCMYLYDTSTSVLHLPFPFFMCVVQAMTKLDHPFINGLDYSFQTPEYAIMAMELVRCKFVTVCV